MNLMTATDTIQIMKSLKPRLGERTAVELIRYIESAHTENLATKEDIIVLEKDLRDLEIRLTRQLSGLAWKLIGATAGLLGIFTAVSAFIARR